MDAKNEGPPPAINQEGRAQQEKAGSNQILHQKEDNRQDDLAVRFFKLILPRTGHLVAAIKGQKGFLHFFADAPEQLWKIVKEHDRRGCEAYFACASFKQPLNDPPGTKPIDRRYGRTFPNVDKAQSFWGDLDAGEDKPYKDSAEALDALKNFINKLKLPLPIVVISGTGLHFYWPLQEELDRTWQRYAAGLKFLCFDHGLHADRSRTADMTSVLRPPGTHNHKYEPPLPVALDPRFLENVEPYALDDFKVFADAYGPIGTRLAPTGERQDRPLIDGADARSNEPPPPSYVSETLKHCGQMQRLRDENGCTPEPQWNACIGVCAFSEDGDEFAHKLSEGYVGDKGSYTYEETQALLERKRASVSGATTCKHFEDIDDKDTCKKCVHRGKINSPYALGIRLPELPDEIAKLNEDYFVIKHIGGKCMIGRMLPDEQLGGEKLTLRTSTSFLLEHANVRMKRGNKTISVGHYWQIHPKRKQYEGVTLTPNGPRELSNGYFNLWRGFGVEAKQGHWPLMRQHIFNVLANGDKEIEEYILNWAAWTVQHPDKRAEAALVFRGDEGAGKGIFARALLKIFGAHGKHIFRPEHLTGNFNGHLESCIFLFVDEGFWAGDKKGESVLKGLITEPTMMLERKGIDAVQWPNYLHIIMASNSDWVVPAGHSARRYAMLDVNNRYAKSTIKEKEKECEAYFEALNNELFKNGGAEAMLHDLLRRDLGKWHPRRIPNTDALRAQKELSLPPLDQWFLRFLEDGCLPLGPVAADMRNVIMSRTLLEAARESVGHGRNCYLSEQELATYLKKWGGTPRRTNTVRGWIIPPLAELRAKWERRFGGRKWETPSLTEWS